MLGIHGLLPPLVTDMDKQSKRMITNLKRLEDNLQRYVFLIGLQDRNEALFYKVWFWCTSRGINNLSIACKYFDFVGCD